MPAHRPRPVEGGETKILSVADVEERASGSSIVTNRLLPILVHPGDGVDVGIVRERTIRQEDRWESLARRGRAGEGQILRGLFGGLECLHTARDVVLKIFVDLLAESLDLPVCDLRHPSIGERAK